MACELTRGPPSVRLITNRCSSPLRPAQLSTMFARVLRRVAGGVHRRAVLTPHATAILSFDANNSSYDALRPTFPAPFVRQALADAGVARGGRVLELAAGTGKFTRLLVEEGFGSGSKPLVVVEPSEGMLSKFRENFPELDSRSGSSYDLGVASESVDCVIAAQALHWFSDEGSLQEIARVLKPGGTFLAVWNFDFPGRAQGTRTDVWWGQDGVEVPRGLTPSEVLERVFPEWAKKVGEVIARYDKDVPQYRVGAWRDNIEKHAGKHLTGVEKEGFFFRAERVRKADVVPYWETRSYVTALAEEGRQAFGREITAAIEGVEADAQGEILRVMGTHYVVVEKV